MPSELKASAFTAPQIHFFLTVPEVVSQTRTYSSTEPANNLLSDEKAKAVAE
ncbi:MAG: hypothetical protein U0793_32160 [Gemmataceae bacterium]